LIEVRAQVGFVRISMMNLLNLGIAAATGPNSTHSFLLSRGILLTKDQDAIDFMRL